METVQNISDKINGIIMDYGPRLIGAIITLIIGMWLISLIRKAMNRRFEKREQHDYVEHGQVKCPQVLRVDGQCGAECIHHPAAIKQRSTRE